MLSLLQNNYLRRIAGRYKYIPKVTLKREAAILLLDLYINIRVLQRIVKIINYHIKRNIKIVINNI